MHGTALAETMKRTPDLLIMDRIFLTGDCACDRLDPWPRDLIGGQPDPSDRRARMGVLGVLWDMDGVLVDTGDFERAVENGQPSS